jgi:hypothetical protein
MAYDPLRESPFRDAAGAFDTPDRTRETQLE